MAERSSEIVGSRPRMAQGVAVYHAFAQRGRRISPQAGRALEILGHAIEYLADEFLFEYHDAPSAWRNGQFAAIQLLMTVDLQIYFDCPDLPSILAFLPRREQ